MNTRSVSAASVRKCVSTDETRDSGYVLRLGLLTYAAVFLLTMFAASFLRVSVYPTVRWSLHVLDSAVLPRAFAVSTLSGMLTAAVMMAGTVLIRRLEEDR